MEKKNVFIQKCDEIRSFDGMIYTAPCLMLLLQGASITWASGRGLPIGPLKSRVYGIDPIGECHLGPEKLETRARPPPTCPSNGCCPHKKHYTWGRINHRSIGGFMYKSSPYRGLCVHTSIIHVHTSMREVSGPIWLGVGEQVHKGT